MVYERNCHSELKRQGKNILLSKGFNKSEILFEYKVNITKDKFYIVDVVGINDKNKVFIECGNLSTGENKLKVLKNFCDELIHLPYLIENIHGRKEFNKIPVTFNDKQWEEIEKYRGIFGNKRAEIVRSIVLNWIINKKEDHR